MDRRPHHGALPRRILIALLFVGCGATNEAGPSQPASTEAVEPETEDLETEDLQTAAREGTENETGLAPFETNVLLHPPNDEGAVLGLRGPVHETGPLPPIPASNEDAIGVVILGARVVREDGRPLGVGSAEPRAQSLTRSEQARVAIVFRGDRFAARHELGPCRNDCPPIDTGVVGVVLVMRTEDAAAIGEGWSIAIEP